MSGILGALEITVTYSKCYLFLSIGDQGRDGFLSRDDFPRYVNPASGNLYGSAVSLAPETALIGAAGLPGAFAIGVAPPVDCNGNGIDDVCGLDGGPFGGPCDLPGCGQSSAIRAKSAAGSVGISS